MAETVEEDVQTRLARERTKLARERTSLAHIRTGFSAFLFGTALLGLFDSKFSRYMAFFFILVGVFFLISSTLSYLMSSERTEKLLALGKKTGRLEKLKDFFRKTRTEEKTE